MEAIKQKLREFNAQSRNTEDHFRLCAREHDGAIAYELRLCSCHPRVITCTLDSTYSIIKLAHHGPSSFHQSFGSDPDSLESLLSLLHYHRDDTSDGGLVWEFEDWVSAGYPCKMHDPQTPPPFPDLGFSPEDLWCIEQLPSRAAYI
jgi:hypothetical protein